MVEPADGNPSGQLPGSGFVAGTPVHTRDGLVPIETIQVHDWVLSRPADGRGEAVYQRVSKTFTLADCKVFSIDFAIDHARMGTLVATGDQRFWVEGIGWTRADQLWPEEGHRLRLHDGSSCVLFHQSILYQTDEPGVGWVRGGFGPIDTGGSGRVVDLRRGRVDVDYTDEHRTFDPAFNEGRASPLRARVYHLDVENDHTCVVGELGVWARDTHGVTG